jgi:hypothetical protein
MILKYAALWLPLPILGIINGIARGALYGRFVSELAAHQISTATLIVLSGIYIWFIGGRWRIESSGQAIAVGVIWLALTVAFEFLFGHYIMGHPWSRLLHDYNVLEGRVWLLVLIWITLAPYVMYRLRA